MSNTQFRNRETIGTKLDLNMIKFQQMPLVPKEGYRKSDVQIRTLTAVKNPPQTDRITLKEQMKKDKMAANSRRYILNREDRLKKVLASNPRFDVRTVVKVLELQHEAARQTIRMWVKDGWVIDTGEFSAGGSSIYVKAGTFIPVSKPRSSSNGAAAAARARGLAVFRFNEVFKEDKELTTREINIRFGDIPKSTKQSIVKTWVKYGLVKDLGGRYEKIDC